MGRGAFGLNGPTRVYINYLHIEQHDIPDGGVPTVGLPGWTSGSTLVTTLPRVDSSNFYGTKSDHNNVVGNMATVKIEHDLGANTQIRNISRWGRTGANAVGSTDTYSVYGFDTLHFGEMFSLNLSARLDHYHTYYSSATACGGTARGAAACPTGVATGSPITSVATTKTGSLFNWKVGPVFKPTSNGTIYTDGLKRGTDSAVGTPAYTDSYWTFNGMASYTPGVPRSFRLTASLKM